MGYEPPSMKDRVRAFAHRVADAAAGRDTEDPDYRATEVEREHRYSHERQNEEAEPEYRQQMKQSKFMAKQDERVQAEKEQALSAREDEYRRTHPESFGAARTTQTVGGIKEYTRRMQLPSNLRKAEAAERERRSDELIKAPAASQEDRQRKSDEIRQRRLAAKSQAERERLDNIAKAQAANQRFQESLEAQRAHENRRDFRTGARKQQDEPRWFDSFRKRLSVEDADAKRQARQSKGQRAAVHGPSIAERIKQRTSGIDFGGMLGGAISAARGEGAEPLPGLSDIKRKVTKGVPAKTRQMSARFDTRLETFAATAAPKAKARLKEIPGEFKANIRESVGEIGHAYLAAQQPVDKKHKRAATLTAPPLDSMFGVPTRRASYRGRGRGSGGLGGIGDIGSMFGGGGGGMGGGLGDIGGMFGGEAMFGGGGGGSRGGGGGGGNYNAGTRNVYRPGARLTCNSCGHSWTMRGTRRPRVCPNCKSYTWSKGGSRAPSGGGSPPPTDFLDPFG